MRKYYKIFVLSLCLLLFSFATVTATFSGVVSSITSGLPCGDFRISLGLLKQLPKESLEPINLFLYLISVEKELCIRLYTHKHLSKHNRQCVKDILCKECQWIGDVRRMLAIYSTKLLPSQEVSMGAWELCAETREKRKAHKG